MMMRMMNHLKLMKYLQDPLKMKKIQILWLMSQWKVVKIAKEKLRKKKLVKLKLKIISIDNDDILYIHTYLIIYLYL